MRDGILPLYGRHGNLYYKLCCPACNWNDSFNFVYRYKLTHHLDHHDYLHLQVLRMYPSFALHPKISNDLAQHTNAGECLE